MPGADSVGPARYSARQMLAERSDQPASRTPQRPQNRLRLAVIDRDPGFMQVLAKRLHARAWDHRNLSSPVTIEAVSSFICARMPATSTGWEKYGSPEARSCAPCAFIE